MSSSTLTGVVRFLGLSELAQTADGETAFFPLGVLYPYSRDLQRVCTCYAAVCRECPDAASALLGQAPGQVASLSPEQVDAVTSYVNSIATLHSRIAFAPGGGGEAVGAAYRVATDALVRTTRCGQRKTKERAS